MQGYAKIQSVTFQFRRSDRSVKASGNYTVDCATGRLYYEKLIKVMQEVQNYLLLHIVLVAIIEAGAITGIEIGFLNALVASLA